MESTEAYATLMQTVESLQADLQQTITTCHGLREANTQLEKNYETCKRELLRQRDKFASTRSQLIEATKAKIEADRSTEGIVRKWKAQLDERTKELDALQAKLVPQDLDMLRIQIQEELELPHQQKIAELEAQGQAFQQMFFNVRRELERNKTEFEQFAQYQASERAAVEERKGAELAALRRRLNDAETNVKSDFEERARAAEAKFLDVQVTSRERLAESESLREELNEAHARATALTLGLKEKLCAADARNVRLDADLKLRDAELRELEGRLAATDGKLRGAQAELDSVRSDAALTDKAAHSSDKQLRKDLGDSTRELEACRRELENERGELARAAAASARRVEALEIEAAAEKRNALDARLGADEAVEAARADGRRLAAGLEDRVVALELAAAQAQARFDDALAASTAEGRKFEAQLKLEQAKVIRLEADISKGFAPRLQEAQDRTATLEAALQEETAKVRALADTQAHLQQALDDLEAERREKLRVAQTTQALVDENEELRRAKDKQQLDHASALATLKAQIKADNVAVAADVKLQTDAIRKKAQDTLVKERKRSNAYKQRALKERDRALKAKDALSRAAGSHVADFTSSLMHHPQSHDPQDDTFLLAGAAAPGVGSTQLLPVASGGAM